MWKSPKYARKFSKRRHWNIYTYRCDMRGFVFGSLQNEKDKCVHAYFQTEFSFFRRVKMYFTAVAKTLSFIYISKVKCFLILPESNRKVLRSDWAIDQYFPNIYVRYLGFSTLFWRKWKFSIPQRNGIFILADIRAIPTSNLSANSPALCILRLELASVKPLSTLYTSLHRHSHSTYKRKHPIWNPTWKKPHNETRKNSHRNTLCLRSMRIRLSETLNIYVLILSEARTWKGNQNIIWAIQPGKALNALAHI